jgi:hypothetical protein
VCLVDLTRSIFQTLSVSHRVKCIVLKLIFQSDDLTVEVIFFGNSDKSGDVVVNREASASAKDIKAKL